MPASSPLRTLSTAASVAIAIASLAAATPALAQASKPAGAQAVKPAVAASLSASSPDAECPALRKEYLESQACFQRYRVANGTVRPEAYKRCREVVDPSPRCGPNFPTR